MFKKFISFIIIFAVTFMMLPNIVPAQSPDGSPRIEAVRGNVFVHRIGGHSAVSAFHGMNIYDGDVIVTSVNSTATLIYYGQMIVLGELTTLSVNSVWQRHGRNNSAVTLVEGMIKVRVDIRLDDNSRNIVKAAGTIIGVRGTKYILTYRRMMYGDVFDGVGDPFARILVIEGEVVVDLPDPDNLGEVATFLVTPEGMQRRIIEDIQGRHTYDEIQDIPEIFIVPLENVDLYILEAIRNDPGLLEQNPELFYRVEEAIEIRRVLEL